MARPSTPSSEPDFDLAALAKRLSIVSMLSDGSQEGGDLVPTTGNTRDTTRQRSSSPDSSTTSNAGSNSSGSSNHATASTAATSFTGSDGIKDAGMLADRTPLARNASYFAAASDFGLSTGQSVAEDLLSTPRMLSNQSQTTSRLNERPRTIPSHSDPLMSPRRTVSLEQSKFYDKQFSTHDKTPRARPKLKTNNTFAGSPSNSRPSSQHSPNNSITLSNEEIALLRRNSRRNSKDIEANSPRLLSEALLSSPRLGSGRSPSLHSRPSLTKSGSSFVVSSSRPGSISRKISYSRPSRPSSLVSASNGVQRRQSNRTNSSILTDDKEKSRAVSLTASELLDVLQEQKQRQEHRRSLSPTSTDYSASSSASLVIDVRPLPVFLGPAKRIRGSVNANFPSLLVKRFKKGKIAHFALEAFITTETGKTILQRALQSTESGAGLSPLQEDSAQPNTAKALAELDLFVIDDHIEPGNNSLGDMLVSVLSQVLEGQIGHGSLCYLRGPFRNLAESKNADDWLVQGEECENQVIEETREEASASPMPRTSSLAAKPSKNADNPNRPSGLNIQAPPSLAPPLLAHSSPEADSRQARRRKSLKRLDTGDSPPSHLTANFSNMPARSPAPLDLSKHHMLTDSPRTASSNSLRPDSAMSFRELCHVQAKSPSKPSVLEGDDDIRRQRDIGQVANSPGTAQPDAEAFIVSCIIPNFLYLGSEPCTQEDVQELESLGIKQILNMALEIDDNANLDLRNRFEKYTRLPMRDFVEETNVQKTIDEACAILDDASLKSKPLYCHCRAGKSRSVTVVLAYLIHRFHWPLKRAYAHVAERRKGISPNIGFISELMRYEERALGTKPHAPGGSLDSNTPSVPMSAYTARRPSTEDITVPSTANAGLSYARMRESMPPAVSQSEFSRDGSGGATEQEIKGLNGVWTYAWQPQMDHFHPNRRVSKAGLESNM